MKMKTLTPDRAMDLSAGAPLDVEPHVCSESTVLLHRTRHHLFAVCKLCHAADVLHLPDEAPTCGARVIDQARFEAALRRMNPPPSIRDEVIATVAVILLLAIAAIAISTAI